MIEAGESSAESQNRDCRPKVPRSVPLKGTPTSPPMPSIALSSATAPPTRGPGSSSLMIDMPTGTSAVPNPFAVSPPRRVRATNDRSRARRATTAG